MLIESNSMSDYADQNRNRVMYDFNSFEEYQRFSDKVERLYGSGSYREVGKHTNNLIVSLPDDGTTYKAATSNLPEMISINVFDRESTFHKELETKHLNKVLKEVGRPAEGMEITLNTDSLSKGAEGLPQQLLEISLVAKDWLIATGGMYGGVRAIYKGGKYLIKVMRHYAEESDTDEFLFNKGAVVALCCVVLEENKSIEGAMLLSAVEAQEGHRWDPTIDARDVYYVTFADAQGNGHLYVANARGAILSYIQVSLANSWDIRPSIDDLR